MQDIAIWLNLRALLKIFFHRYTIWVYWTVKGSALRGPKTSGYAMV